MHILSFNPIPKPAMAIRENGSVEELKFEDEARMTFSPHKACVGYKADDGWHKCSNRAINMRQCPTCQFRDIARIYTVGDFTYYPHMHEKLEDETYILYLAQFGADITKLGLTRESRMFDRWREQGADFAAPIMRFDGPDRAYPAEQLLQSTFDLHNAVTMRQKLARLRFSRSKAHAKIDRILKQIKSNPSFADYIYEGARVHDLSSHYPDISDPVEVEFIGGKICGTKSDWLFFEGETGQHYCINMRRQIGKFIQLPRAHPGQELL